MTLPTQNGKERVAFEVRTEPELRDHIDSMARKDRPGPGRYQHQISRNSTINNIFRLLRLFGIGSTEELREKLKSAKGSSPHI